MSQVFQAMLLGPLVSISGGKKLTTMTVMVNKDLDFIKELLETEKVKPVIDKRFSLDKIVEALKYYDQGHTRGKIVITV